MKIRSFILTMILSIGICSGMNAQEHVKQMVGKHRQSLIHLRISKTTETGEVVQQTATGFVVSDRGHVITNCHAIDRVLRDEEGHILSKVVDAVSVMGGTGSKEAPREGLTVLGCAQTGIDLALLKFKDSSLKRLPVKIVSQQPTVGDELAAMGFPLNAEFFARPGTLSNETDQDTLLVAMVLNAGDSGAPVFDKNIRVVAVAEGGFGSGTGIGVVRPIRHAANLLAMAGVNLFAIDTTIFATPAPNQPANSKIFVADPSEANKAFNLGLKKNVADSDQLSVTYPVYKQIAEVSSANPFQIDMQTLPAKPGYKVVGANFIVTEFAGVEVIHVGVSADGSSARATFEKAKSNQLMASGTPFLRGYVQTVQVKVGPN